MLSLSALGSDLTLQGQWSTERAQQWYKQQPWLVRCNFTPSTAINQLEMWQEDTFDPKMIDRELGWDLYNEPGNGSSGEAAYIKPCVFEMDLIFC